MHLAPRLLVVAGLVLALSSSAARADEADSYPLDTLSRDVDPGHRPHCPLVDMTRYGGSLIRYQKPTLIYPGLASHLRALEELARQTAIEVYGRAPIRLQHVGTFNCRAVRGIANLLSEHALGNAIDVEGFDFGPAPRGSNAPRGLRGPFTVRLGRDWKLTRGVGALHAQFLRLFAQRVIEHTEMFRVVLGPSYPGHQGHFHFDLAPYRLVDVFGEPSGS